MADRNAILSSWADLRVRREQDASHPDPHFAAMVRLQWALLTAGVTVNDLADIKPANAIEIVALDVARLVLTTERGEVFEPLHAARGGRDAEIIRWLEEILPDRLIVETPKAKAARRRRRATQATPMTRKQADAVFKVQEHNGNVTAAAKASGKSRQAMQKLYDLGIKKLGRTATKPKTQGLPHDRRGQVDVPDRD